MTFHIHWLPTSRMSALAFFKGSMSRPSAMCQVGLCLKLEHCEGIIRDGSTTIFQRFLAALQTPCLCKDRAWAVAAREIVAGNCLDESMLCADIRKTLLLGLKSKGDVLTFSGWGNEGKSFLIRPLTAIYEKALFGRCL